MRECMLDFPDFVGIVYSLISEVLSIPLINFSVGNYPDTTITFGSLLLYSAIIPVLYHLLFPSVNK